MAKRRLRGRPLNGIILLDKPLEMSSNKALQQVKGLYFAQKAGHTGSLDPLATGMLPICFGEATKFSQFLLDADKHYQVTAQLGVRTNTCDSEGEVIATAETATINHQLIEAVLEKFRGTIEQIPSMFSALKHQGVPLYKLARKGIEVERRARTVIISLLSILAFEPSKAHLTLDVKCSKGTYIRNLVDDIGQALGCGAHVIALRRLSVSHFDATKMLSLTKLEALRQQQAFAALDALLLPLENISQSLPQLRLTSAAAFRLRQGQLITHQQIQTTGLVSLSVKNEGFIGIGEISADGILQAKRLLKY